MLYKRLGYAKVSRPAQIVAWYAIYQAHQARMLWWTLFFLALFAWFFYALLRGAR